MGCERKECDCVCVYLCLCVPVSVCICVSVCVFGKACTTAAAAAAAARNRPEKEVFTRRPLHALLVAEIRKRPHLLHAKGHQRFVFHIAPLGHERHSGAQIAIPTHAQHG